MSNLTIQFMELVGGAEEKRDWKGITLAILCIILIGSLVALSVLILSPDDIVLGPELDFSESLSLERKFRSGSIYKRKQWKAQGLYTMSEEGDIIVTYRNGTQAIKLDKTTLQRDGISEWDVSWDGNFCLVKQATNYILRDIRDGNNGISTKLDILRKVSWAEFGPMGSQLIYLGNEKLYYRKRLLDQDGTAEVLITKSKTSVIPSRIFHQEVFQSRPSLWWNSAGTKVAFSEFVYDSVPQLQLPRLYQDTVPNYQWPFSTQLIHFPIAGDTLPTVQLKVINLEFDDEFDMARQTLSQSIGSTRSILKRISKSSYLMNIEWMSETEFVAIWTNSNQSESVFDRCFVGQDGCEQIIKETSQRDTCYLPMQAFRGVSALSEVELGILRPDAAGLSGDFLHPFILNISRKPAALSVERITLNDTFGNQDNSSAFKFIGKNDIGQMIYISNGNDAKAKHIFLQQRGERPICATCTAPNPVYRCQNVEVDCASDMTWCVVECVAPVNDTVPFTYAVRNLTVQNWSYDPASSNFIMVESNPATYNQA